MSVRSKCDNTVMYLVVFLSFSHRLVGVDLITITSVNTSQQLAIEKTLMSSGQ
jgi:hypothetical protein